MESTQIIGYVETISFLALNLLRTNRVQEYPI